MSTADGAAFCVMLAAGEANLAVLGAAIALGEITLGLLTSVPPVCGAALQLATVRLVRWSGSHKRWMVCCALLQAATFLPLAIGAALGGLPGALLFAAATLYWGANLSCGATWNTLISGVVPRRVRAKYFSSRNVLLNLAQLVAIFVGGWILESARAGGQVFAALAGLLAFAAAARAFSAYCLHLHVLKEDHPPGFRDVPTREALGRFRDGPGGRVLAYRLAVQFALNVSTPFITPYLMKRHGLENHLQVYSILNGLLILAKALAMPLWGRVARIHGARLLLRLGGVLIIPIPALWLAADHVTAFAAVQIFSGLALSAYELGTFLIMFDTVPEPQRTSIVSKFNFADNIAVASGSLLGAKLMDRFGPSGYAAAFAGSLALRSLALMLLARVPRTAADHVPEGISVEVHPSPGAVDQPVLASYDIDGEGAQTRRGGGR